MSIYDIATLADQLAELYPTIDDGRRILTQAGINAIEVDYSNRPRDNWWNILQVTAYKKGALRNLLDFTVKENPENKLIAILLTEIISFDEVGGKSTGDAATKRGRLLRTFENFHKSRRDKAGSKDIFYPQANQYDDSNKGLRWFQQLMDLSRSVGVIQTSHSYHSAILLREGYVLTYFIDATPESLKDTQLFIQEDQSNDLINKIVQIELDPNFIRNHTELHYTLLQRVDVDLNFGLFLPLASCDSCIGEEVNLISHPFSHEKRISGGIITGEEGHELHYTTKSISGPSGGPLLYNGNVIAMQSGVQERFSATVKPPALAVKIADILKDAGLPINRFTNQM